MAPKYDITDDLPLGLSNPQSSVTYQRTGEAYDLSINGQPFFIYATDETPYRRQTAQYRKEQIDQTTEPGEQTLSGWWLRSQSSFHNGTGITYYDPSAGETVGYRYFKSEGVEVFNKGEVTLLKNTARIVTSANDIKMVAANDSSNDCFVFIDGSNIKKVTMSTDTATTSTYSLAAGHTTQVFTSITTDGFRYFAADEVAIHRGNIGGSTGDETTYATGTSNVVIKFVKQRLMAGVANSIYELNPNVTTAGSHSTVALPTALFTHPNSNWTWTSITEGPNAIYFAGKARTTSSIFRIPLSNTAISTGGFPTLIVPSVVADFPDGEVVNAMDVYLGTYMIICTNKGVRAATVNEDGSLSYGPLIFEGESKAVTFRDRFAYVTTLLDGDSGVVKIDLGAEIQPLRFAYAWNIVATGETLVPLSIAFLGGTNRLGFAVPGDGIWIEKNSELVSTGYLQTGRIRYSTLENKVFKILRPLIVNTNGAISIQSIDKEGTEYNIGSFGENSAVSDVGIAYPAGAQEYISIKITLNRKSTDSSKGPTVKGYQLKALPAVPRQRLIQYPLACYDIEKDRYNVSTGYEDSAYERLTTLETLEDNGDSVRVDDFRTGESYVGLIEEVNFINRTPSDKRFSGFGGILLVTIRTL